MEADPINPIKAKVNKAKAKVSISTAVATTPHIQVRANSIKTSNIIRANTDNRTRAMVDRLTTPRQARRNTKVLSAVLLAEMEVIHRAVHNTTKADHTISKAARLGVTIKVLQREVTAEGLLAVHLATMVAAELATGATEGTRAPLHISRIIRRARLEDTGVSKVVEDMVDLPGDENAVDRGICIASYWLGMTGSTCGQGIVTQKVP